MTFDSNGVSKDQTTDPFPAGISAEIYPQQGVVIQKQIYTQSNRMQQIFAEPSICKDPVNQEFHIEMGSYTHKSKE
jgi:hypothetical protein